ncbi:Sec-independent protein translocase protein TatB [Conservatibacter flavescens]|uniref:Sec-independent protein translocase protein TatB n=1 Tax=Conservatibacter flavescens TaxID=28161 RepID=A0A2M8S1V7_9PAST|nr:Sec-independent protein translocase protein TatB [Conservatibacter flavescens]PJG85123.1 twin-arginine translocase subunit TatB [Conservatibacter flavescens]
MFDIGFSEIVLVLIVGLIVLGPQRMPVAIRTVMSWVNTLRGLATNVKNELNQELKLQELQESIKKAESLNLNALSPELSKTVEELKESAKKMQDEMNNASQNATEELRKATDKVQQAIDTDLKNAELAVENAVEAQDEREKNPSELTALSTEKSADDMAADIEAEEAEREAQLAEMLDKYQTVDDFEPTSVKEKTS